AGDVCRRADEGGGDRASRQPDSAYHAGSGARVASGGGRGHPVAGTWRHGGVVRPYGEGRDATSRLVIRRQCMMLGPKYPTGYYNYREDFEKLDNADEVIAKVQRDRNAI